MNLFTRLILFSSLSSVVSIFFLNTEAKAFTLNNLQVNVQITSPTQGQIFPNGSTVAGTGIASWTGTISTLDEKEPITLLFSYSLQHANKPVKSFTTQYTYASGLNLVPVGSGVLNVDDIAGPLSPGSYVTSMGAYFNGKLASDGLSWKVVPEPLTILGSATAMGFGAFFKRKLKPSKSTEKVS
ncbi:PEP-CTERM sorting domain-containing protein [Aphanothece sacrum]|uniref:PEP-CTERM protein-sorting domain-containing protein n=1 Tax=Aphanothece sacrum FPU1 TaxID=1920663 RepID=A0A401II44_APHSA|nr:PEP-CTERM sorting domain-containing protein [Aphanothece sacrum]GBF80924.1 hypothetical protein AsFPU1_2333 [Aphanothece sacrum FPU1]GBF85231.1 hypothetical protein AsFPU3_2290 [Aphanothece sacrum FPU3]